VGGSISSNSVAPAIEGLEGVGNTPLQSISIDIDGDVRHAALKLEGYNVCGSIKDRTARSLVESLERDGRLRGDSIIVESTSGNLGSALAMIARNKGYRFHAVVDPKVTPENLAKMRAFDATIDVVDVVDQCGGYLSSRLEHVRELCASSPRFVWTDQYSNWANPRAHYRGTAPELWGQMQGRVEAVFVPVSTGGTLAGVGRFFREVSPSTRIIGVDARGSVIFGGPPGPRRLTGIGASKTSTFITPDVYDEHILVGDDEGFSMCRILFKATGLKVGGSSGAVLAACAVYLRAHPELTTAACICADHGDNYAQSIFSDRWLDEQGVHLQSGARLGIGTIALESGVERVGP
jgi:2,3-diaminopropionate biosynthesis protein SbnA